MGERKNKLRAKEKTKHQRELAKAKANAKTKERQRVIDAKARANAEEKAKADAKARADACLHEYPDECWENNCEQSDDRECLRKGAFYDSMTKDYFEKKYRILYNNVMIDIRESKFKRDGSLGPLKNGIRIFIGLYTSYENSVILLRAKIRGLVKAITFLLQYVLDGISCPWIDIVKFYSLNNFDLTIQYLLEQIKNKGMKMPFIRADCCDLHMYYSHLPEMIKELDLITEFYGLFVRKYGGSDKSPLVIQKEIYANSFQDSSLYHWIHLDNSICVAFIYNIHNMIPKSNRRYNVMLFLADAIDFAYKFNKGVFTSEEDVDLFIKMHHHNYDSKYDHDPTDKSWYYVFWFGIKRFNYGDLFRKKELILLENLYHEAIAIAERNITIYGIFGEKLYQTPKHSLKLVS